MKSNSDSFDLSVRLTRRTARVTISVSAAAWQRDINCLLRYFPVPTNSREPNVLLAMVNVSCIRTIMDPAWEVKRSLVPALRELPQRPRWAPRFRQLIQVLRCAPGYDRRAQQRRARLWTGPAPLRQSSCCDRRRPERRA